MSRQTTDPEQILGWVNVPRTASVNEVVRLEIEIKNTREVPFFLHSVDVDGSFLDGFEILTFNPDPDEYDYSRGYLTLWYAFQMEAGESRRIEIALRARSGGTFIGEVDIWAGEEEAGEFLTRHAQVEIAPQRH